MNLLFPEIMFEESNHTYFNKNTGEIYTSVTTELKKYKKPFNKSFWLQRKAQERNISIQQLDQEWKNAAIIGSTAGTALHFFLENYFKNKIAEYPIIVPDECYEKTLAKYNNLKPQALNFVKDFQYKVLYQEAILQMNNLAGQTDMICEDENGDMIVVDFKTDKKLEETKEKMLGDLKHLSASTLNKHTLQVSIYQTMLENIGKTVSKRLIVWFCENNDNYKIIEVPYLKTESLKILNNK